MNQAVANTTISYQIPGVDNLTIANRENGRKEYKAGVSIEFTHGFDTEGNAEIDAFIDKNYVASIETVVATATLPNISGYEPLVFAYYDDYNYAGAKSFTGEYNGRLNSANSPDAEAIVPNSFTKGMATGTKVRILGTNQWLTTTTIYDRKGRTIQVLADNISGGTDILTTMYDFTGRALSMYHDNKNLRSATSANIRMLTMFSYDHAGRLLALKKRLNDDPALERIIYSNEFDALGRNKIQRIGVKADGSYLEDLNYEYNVQGWLKSINKSYVNTPNSVTNKFGVDISYDYGFSKTRKDGNIAGVKWKGFNDRNTRAYGYQYDKNNQLLGADFSQQTPAGNSWTKDQIDFSVSNLRYDANGNILSMTQRGLKGGTSQVIDSLKYGYLAQSNKLDYVTDKNNDPKSTLGDFKEINNNEQSDYTYDTDGNLTKDLNRNISKITYNYLSQVEEIIVEGKGSIKYVYDADGTRLRKIIKENGQSDKVTDYINGLVFMNDSLLFAGHEQGRIRALYKTGQPVSYVYDYFVPDHQKNVRLVLTEQTDFTFYAATMETVAAEKESALFSNVQETRVNKPAGYPADNRFGQNNAVAKLSAKAGGRKIGPSLVLRVMAGDSIQLAVNTFYKSTGPSNNQPVATVEDMVASLVQSFSTAAALETPHGGTAASASTPFNTNFYTHEYNRLKEKDPTQSQQDRPRAYLNYVLFDDQWNMVENSSGVRQVKAAPDQLQRLVQEKMPISKSGFLYIYTSNETQEDVYFDNLEVGHSTGPVLQENHYYPFGGLLAGISYEMPVRLQNSYRFNGGSELEESLGLNVYSTPLRMYDPQIGRFWGQDIAGADNPAFSPYNFALNNPAFFNDPTGAKEKPTVNAIIDMLMNSDAGGYWQSGMSDAFFYAADNSGGTLISSGIRDLGSEYAFTVGGYFRDENGSFSMANENGSTYRGSFLRITVGKGWVDAINRQKELDADLDKAQLALDAAGFVPGLQTAAGIANAGIDFARGNYLSGAFNLLTAIPVAGILVKGAKLATIGIVVARETRLVRAAENSSNLWRVGAYRSIKGLERGLDAHHVGQKAVMKEFVPGYDLTTAPSILVPARGHTIAGPSGIVSRSTAGFTNARQVLARDIFELRRVYGAQGIPNTALLDLIQMNKAMYPAAFVK